MFALSKGFHVILLGSNSEYEKSLCESINKNTNDKCVNLCCSPIYEEFEGFDEDISGCKSFDELPEACKKYIARLEEVCECKVVMVGNGPDRSQILER